MEVGFRVFPLQFLLSIWVMPDKIRSELASLVKQLFMDRVRRRTSRKARSRILVVRMDSQRSGGKSASTGHHLFRHARLHPGPPDHLLSPAAFAHLSEDHPALAGVRSRRPPLPPRRRKKPMSPAPGPGKGPEKQNPGYSAE